MTKCNEVDLAALLDTDEEHFRSADNLAEIARHVEACTDCQRRLEQLAANEDQWDEVPAWLSPGDRSADGFVEVTRVGERWKRPATWSDKQVRSLLAPASHPEMLGRIGRYDVERLIGSGGMGVVCKAWDTELNRPVAIKLLAPYLAESGAARKRFAREARAAAAVVDDHVVPIHNVESNDTDLPFLVMQYIAGGSLQQRLDHDGPLEVAEILRIGMQTAKGLAAAHAQGLIHRDVKPSNILLDEGVERALLTDFGLARAEDDACLTRSGFHPGTPHYMSPEQVRGEPIDPRSDLFGLGCVLYALCTGHPPFRTASGYAVLRRITDDTPRSVREINVAIPEWLDWIVLKLLAKSPDDRCASAAEVAATLEGCLAHLQQPTLVCLPALCVPTRETWWKCRFQKFRDALRSRKSGLIPPETPNSNIVSGFEERRIKWYWAVALLLPIGAASIAAIFTPLLLWFQTQPGTVLPQALVIGAGVASSVVSFFAWRLVLVRFLSVPRTKHVNTERGFERWLVIGLLLLAASFGVIVSVWPGAAHKSSDLGDSSSGEFRSNSPAATSDSHLLLEWNAMQHSLDATGRMLDEIESTQRREGNLPAAEPPATVNQLEEL